MKNYHEERQAKHQPLWLGLPKSEAALKHTNKLKPSFKKPD